MIRKYLFDLPGISGGDIHIMKFMDFDLETQVWFMRTTEGFEGTTEDTESEVIEAAFEQWFSKYDKEIQVYVNKYKSLCGSAFSEEDLVQEAWWNLLLATEGYDPEMCKFSTYVARWLDNGLRGYVNESRNVIHLSSDDQKLIGKVKKAEKNYKKEHGDEPGTEELAAECGIDISKVEFAIKANDAATNYSSLNNRCNDDADEFEDLIGDDRLCFEYCVESDFARERLIRLMDSELKKVEADALKYRFGFVDREEHTYDEVALYIGANSRQNANQIISRALKKLKRVLGDTRAA